MSDRLWSDDSENSGSNSSGRRVGTVQMYKLKDMHFEPLVLAVHYNNARYITNW